MRCAHQFGSPASALCLSSSSSFGIRSQQRKAYCSSHRERISHEEASHKLIHQVLCTSPVPRNRPKIRLSKTSLEGVCVRTYHSSQQEKPSKPLLSLVSGYKRRNGSIPRPKERSRASFFSWTHERRDGGSVSDELLGAQPNRLISRSYFGRHTSSSNHSHDSFSDRFHAQLIATRGVTPEGALHFLRAVGVSCLGPLSFRQLMYQNQTSISILKLLRLLREAQIGIPKSTFARLILKHAQRGDNRLLSLICTTDQHPDSLEDKELQLRLLREYTLAHDWESVLRTLAILSELTTSVDESVWKLVFCHHVETFSPEKHIQMIQEFQSARIAVPSTLYQKPARAVFEKKKKPAAEWLKDYTELRISLKRSSLLDGVGSFSLWQGLFRALGERRLFQELDGLLLELAWLFGHDTKGFDFSTAESMEDDSWKLFDRRSWFIIIRSWLEETHGWDDDVTVERLQQGALLMDRMMSRGIAIDRGWIQQITRRTIVDLESRLRNHGPLSWRKHTYRTAQHHKYKGFTRRAKRLTRDALVKYDAHETDKKA